MDAFEMKEQNQPTRKISSIIWNVLTVLVLLMVLCLGAFFLMILLNPSSSLNLFPPPTLPATISFPTATPTSQFALPPTWTPEPTRGANCHGNTAANPHPRAHGNPLQPLHPYANRNGDRRRGCRVPLRRGTRYAGGHIQPGVPPRRRVQLDGRRRTGLRPIRSAGLGAAGARGRQLAGSAD